MKREQLIDFYMHKYGVERWIAQAFADAATDDSDDSDDEDDDGSITATPPRHGSQ